MTDSNTPSPGPGRAKSQKEWKKWLFENVTSGALALIIVLMIRSSIVEPFKIPSGSMIPTLFIGDHIFVNKFAYGIKLPFSDWVLDEPLYLVKRDPPKRGDIVVFLFPKDESLHYIKRVIGVPGDTIEVRNKVLFINQNPVARDPLALPESESILKRLDDPKYAQGNMDVFTEHLDKADHLMMTEKNNYMGENSGPIVVPPNSLFVMGDNRDFSNDSRFWGFVPMRNVKGKAMVIWLSLWISFSDSQFFFRPDRIGTVLH